jgi:hypothetical protein
MPMPARLADLSTLSLDDLAQLADAARLPPVESWNPASSGRIDIRIARDGQWWHDGSLIARENIVRLFSTILRREADGSHVLVTPAERWTIEVEDAAFLAVELKSEGVGDARRLAFRLNSGDVVMAGADHPLQSRGDDDAPAHYLHVRGGLEARIGRAVYYELADLALEEGHDPPGLWSDGVFFAL